MAFGGVSAGAVFVKLGAELDRRGFVDFEKQVVKAQKVDDIKTRLGGNFDRGEFKQYEEQLDRVQKRVAKRDAFKAALGGDYDSRAFRAYERDLDKAQRQTGVLGRATDRATGSVKNLTRGMGLAAGAAGAAGLGLALARVAGTTVSFDRAMRNVNSIAQLSEKRLASLGKEVRSLAGRTAQAPQTLAEGLYDLVSSGFDAKEAMTILASSAKAATAGLSTTEVSTKAVAAVLNAYRRPAKDAAEISDTLFQTVNLGVISFEQLAENIGDTLPFASQLGISLNEVGAATSTMTKQGLSAAETMTRIRNVIVTLLKPGDALQQAFDKLGFSSAESLIKAKGFQGSLEALIGTTDGSKEAVAALFPNIRSLGGALSLTGKNAKSAEKDLAGFRDVGGATDKALSQQARSISFQWNKVKAQFAAVSIELGTKLAPAAITALKAVGRFVGEMESGDGAGGRFVDKLEDIADKFRDVGEWIKDHIDLIKIAAAAWVAYKVQATLAAGAAKAAAFYSMLPGRGPGKGGGAPGAGVPPVAAPVPTGKGVRGIGAGLGGAVAGTVVLAGGLNIAQGLLKGPSGPDTGLLNKYADALERVVRAGDAKGMRDLAGKLRDTASANQDLTKGENLRRFADALDDTASKGGKDLSAIAAAFSKLERSTGGSLEKVRENVGKLAGANTQTTKEIDRAWGRTLPQVERDIKSTFGVMRSTTDGHLTDIRNSVKTNTAIIKQRLKDDPEAGRKALARNFRLAAREIKESMDDGKISTETGTRQIRRLLIRAMKQLGFSEAEADARLGSGLRGGDVLQLPSQRRPGQRAPVGDFAGGGWIGNPGMVGSDTVPAMLAPGEAVLNRHQQAVVEGLLGDGFLDALFARVNRPHYMAKGGIVPVPGFPGEQAASSVIPMIEQIARRFGLVLTDAFGQGHKSPGHTRFGTAADFAGSDRAMDAAVRFLVGRGYTVGYDGRFGSQAWPGHGPSSVAGSNAHLHVELGSGGSLAIPKILAPRIGGAGALRAIAQRGLGVLTGAANDQISAAAASFSAPVAGGGSGGMGKSALAGLWRRAGGPGNIANLMAAIGLAESGGRSRAHNPSGASGLWQILGQIVPGNIYDPLVNARNAVAKWRTQGLGAWEAYTNGSYRQYLARGGRVSNRTPVVTGSSRQAMSGSGFSIATPKRLVKARLAEADDLTDRIEGMEASYAVKDREYSLSDEELVNEDGSINQAAIDQRVKELTFLKHLREQILHTSIVLRRVLARARASYRTILKRLRGAIKHVNGKDRKAYTTQIGDYQDALGEVSGRITELDRTTIPMGRLDVKELAGELASVAGTQATGGDTGGDVGAGSTADADAIAAQATARADVFQQRLQAANQIIAGFSSAGDIGTGGSSAFAAVANASGPVGAQFASVLPAGGKTAVGAADGGNVYNFNMPGHPQVLRAIGDYAVGGISQQPSISSSVEKLGI